jgi:hypothetical protein
VKDVGVAAVALIILFDVSVTRRRGQGVNPKAMAVIPVLAGLWNGWQLFGGPRPSGIPTSDAVFLVTGMIVAVVLGVPRGRAVVLWSKDGFLHQRYGRGSLRLWGVLFAFGIGLAVGAHHIGAHRAGGPNAVGLLLGSGDLAELYTVYSRALGTGIPFPPPKLARSAGRHRAGRSGLLYMRPDRAGARSAYPLSHVAVDRPTQPIRRADRAG